VRVDIPNTMDAEWKIDVRKANAQMPPVVRNRLRRIVERLHGTSKRTYKRRGQKLVDDTRMPFWTRNLKDGKIYYRPNSDHPALSGFADSLPDEFRHGFWTCLKLVGSGLPMGSLHADMLGAAEDVHADEADFASLAVGAETAIKTLLGMGMTVSDAVDSLCANEPLHSHKEDVRKLAHDIKEGGQQ